MKIELSEVELSILDQGLEALNKVGISRQDSQQILKLSVKLQENPNKNGSSK